MPLRDHFRPPLDDRHSWEGFHGAWPTLIVMALNRQLPPRYAAEPRVHLGATMEVDVATFDDDDLARATAAVDDGGGVATATWAPPRPTFAGPAGPPDQDAYEVLVHDLRRGRRLVAAIELVSPRNKDRPEARRAFVDKCAGLLRAGVAVAVVDLVTTRQFNLYVDLLASIGARDPAFATGPPPAYAAACRWARGADAWRIESWAHGLAVGRPLPTLPLWLADGLAVPLDLESSYEETCRVLRLP